MKKYPKIVQADQRGQIVIPKEIRHELDIEEGSGFYMFLVKDSGIFLKKIEKAEIEHDPGFQELRKKSHKIGVRKKDIDETAANYKTGRRFEEI